MCLCVALKTTASCLLVSQTGTLQPPSQWAESQVGLYCDAGHRAVQVGECPSNIYVRILSPPPRRSHFCLCCLSVSNISQNVVNRLVLKCSGNIISGTGCRCLHFGDVMDQHLDLGMFWGILYYCDKGEMSCWGLRSLSAFPVFVLPI